jgi:hypothetical protein
MKGEGKEPGPEGRARSLVRGVFAASVALAAISATGRANDDLRFRGSVEVTVHPKDEVGLGLNYYNRGDSPYDPIRFRFFIDAAPSDRLQVLTQFRFDDNLRSGFTMAGAYLLYELASGGRLFLEAGKIPSPFGTFAERDYSDKSALIGTPLLYYYHSNLISRAVPANEDDLLATRGQGQFGTSYPSVPSVRFRGSPILYTPCWDYGAILLGAHSDFEYRFGIIAGTAGVPISGEETNELPSLIGRFGWVPRSWVRVGLSGSVGPYLPTDVAGAGDPLGGEKGSGGPFPEGKDAEDYLQSLAGVDFETSHGRWSLWAEAVHNRFQSPWIRDDLTQNAFYVELQRQIVPGLDAAVRWDQIVSGKIESSSGREVRWDVPVQRVEVGSAYHFSRELQLKANVQMTGYGLRASSIGDEVLTSLQLVGSF